MNTSEQVNQTNKVLAGFWIRLLADAIDMAVLWVIGFILGFFLETWFIKLGGNVTWIGLLISIAYFVPMQSTFGKGQSLGKRLLGIQVLDMKGQPLSLAKSFIRYLVIAFVGYSGIFTGVINLLLASSLIEFANLVTLYIGFFALAGCYFLLPIHPLKRGLHDLLADSLVVYQGRFNLNAIATLNDPKKTKKAFLIFGIIIALMVFVGIWSKITIKKNSALTNIQEIQKKLTSSGKFHVISINDFTNYQAKPLTLTSRSFTLQALVDGPFNQSKEDLKPLYDIAFQTVRDQLKDLSQYNNLRVGLGMGYDLGIRKKYIILYQDENAQIPGERKFTGSHINF
ncbi:MAG: RDD family protein [Chryseobacterium sp.]